MGDKDALTRKVLIDLIGHTKDCKRVQTLMLNDCDCGMPNKPEGQGQLFTGDEVRVLRDD